jgi:hypothetical protein
MNPTLTYSWRDRLRFKEGVAALGLLSEWLPRTRQ